MAPTVAFADQSQGDNAFGVPYVSTSFTPTAGHRYALLVVYAHANSDPIAPASTTHAGTGLTITLKRSLVCKPSGSNRTAMSVYSVDAGPSVTGGTFSTLFSSQNIIGCGWSVIDLDTYGVVWGNRAEGAAVTANGATQTVTVPLAATWTTSRPLYFHSANSGTGWDVEAGWTELQEVGQANPSMTRMVAWNAAAWDASATVTNNTGISPAAGIIAYELAPASSAGLVHHFAYSWDDGTNGVGLVTNSGVGVAGQSGTNTYTTEATHGAMALRSTNGLFYNLLGSGALYGIVADQAGQVDVYFQPESVTTTSTIFRLEANAGTYSAVRLNSNGTISLVPVSGTTVATAGTWTDEQWHRVSVRWTARVSNTYTITARVYFTAESTTYEQISTTATATDAFDRVTFGASGTGAVGVTDTIRVYPDVSSWPEPLIPAVAYSGSVALSGSGTLTASGTATEAHTGTVALTGTGTITITGTPRPTGTAGLTGSGTLTASGAATFAYSGTAALSGSGALTTAGTPRPAASAPLTGAGTLTGTGHASVTGGVSLAGSGTLEGTAAPRLTGAAQLAGAGSLAGSGDLVSIIATVALSGTGTLTLTFFTGTLVTPPHRVVTFPAVGRRVEFPAVGRTVSFPAVDRELVTA